MSDTMSRREMLQAAGGITFLALSPVAGRGFAQLAAAESKSSTPAAPLLYTATPYIQPGAGSKLLDGRESIIVAWQTEARAARFVVEYGARGCYNANATVTRTQPYLNRKERDPVFNYAAALAGLTLNAKYDYRVLQDGAVIAEGYFTTRKPRGVSIRFIAFGDNSFGDPGQRAVAYHAYKALPDFVMNTGDNVYEGGLNNEYVRHFFPVYNVDVAHPRAGAPLLRSVPFYTVPANHDVHDSTPDKRPIADFDKNPDNLGYYSLLHLPQNGPTPPQPTPISGKTELLDAFKAAAGERFPRQANYSFDYGDAHFLCLDSNVYVDTTDQRWLKFIEADLAGADARWKFVVHHHPAFNVGHDHYTEQHMRLFSPLFEKHGVDFVLSGHEHNYQRTKPLRFSPRGPGNAGNVNKKDRLVPGTFTIDEKFDGRTTVKPEGVIYVTTGAGGKHLYDPGFTDAPSRWLHKEDDDAAYCAKMSSDRHSFTIFDIAGDGLTMQQVDEWGREIDSIRVVKG